MRKALENFEQNIERARYLVGLYVTLSNKVTSAVDLSDMLRAAIVQSVSSLDHAIHEFVRLGMLEELEGKRPQTIAFAEFVNSNSIDANLTSERDYKISSFTARVKEVHGWKSFQNSDKIKKAIALCYDGSLWEEVAERSHSSVRNVCDGLQLIVAKRNMIAHEADQDPSNPGKQWPISVELTNAAINTVETFVLAIYETIVRTPTTY